MLSVLTAADIEKISLGEATIVPILCTLLLTVNDMRSEISALRSSLEALDSHTCACPTTAEIQRPVQDGATLPISNTLRDLSHRMAGALLPHPTLASSGLSAGRATQAAPPKGAQAPHPQRPNPSQPKQGMDPDVPRYHPATKTFYGNPEAYGAKFPESWEAKTFNQGRYPAANTFSPVHEDPLWASPPSSTPVALGSCASAVTGQAGPGKRGKKRAPAGGAAQVASMSMPPFG